jgi:Flp pilus assembly protein TadG
MSLLRKLRRDENGASALEFALLAPALIGFLICIAQVGILFYANAGLSNALADGARLAVIFPRPTNAQISARIVDRRYGLDPTKITGPTYVSGTSNGAPFIDITMSYAVPLDFVFFQATPITLEQSRRVYVQATS